MPVEGAAVAEQQKVTPTKEIAATPPPTAETAQTPDKVGPAKNFARWLKARLTTQVSPKDVLTGKAQRDALKELVKGPAQTVAPGEQAALDGAATAAAADAAGVGSLEQIADVPGDLDAGAAQIATDAQAAKSPSYRQIRKGVDAAQQDPYLARRIAEKPDSKLTKILRFMSPIHARRLDKVNPYDASKAAQAAKTSTETPGQGPGPSSTK
jgi:hypothetical protein